jgi:type IV pilus assembly protein PilA
MKKNNKGFSLVELIIVIAIMAILAGALAPALIKYIAKSRRSTDVSNAQTIATAVTNALSVEDAYDAAVGGTSYTVSNSGTGITPVSVFSDEVLDQLGTSTYKPKYDKGQSFIFTLSSDLKTFKIYVNSSELYPDVNSAYK